MKTYISNLFLRRGGAARTAWARLGGALTRSRVLPALIAALALVTAGRVTAQTFTTIKSFGILTNVTGFNPQSTLVQGLDGTLYGTATYGESSVAGTVFKMQPDGSGFTALKLFTNSIEGANPYRGLELSGSVLYGTTANGGSSNYGTVFKLNTDGTGYAVLKHFTGSDGANPYYAGLMLSGSVIYGATYYGGSSNYGTVFKLNTNGTGYTVLKSFAGYAAGDGANPNAGLTLSGSVLYGTTEAGGRSGFGTVFRINTDGTGFTILRSFLGFPGEGAYPDGVLTLSGGVLYGTTYRGSSSGYGTVFKLNTNGTGYAVLKSFDYDNDGAYPSGAMALSGGVLYGTTTQGGSSVSGFMVIQGTVFKVSTNGTGYTVLKNFAGSTLKGATPAAGVTLSGGMLYGTTYDGGNSYGGTVFRVNPDGTGYTVLKNFGFSDGANPQAALTLSDSVLYGTTESGGGSGNGTGFKVNTDGTGFSILHNFTATDGYDGTNSDGHGPIGGLVLSGNTLYGTARIGGSSGNGTVFAVNTDGTGFTNLHNFTALSGPFPYTNSDGYHPNVGLVTNSSGNILYGTTPEGGSGNSGTVFAVNIDGTGFTLLHSFTAASGPDPYDVTNSDGASPLAGLVLAGNTLYGTTWLGGDSGGGTVYTVNTDGTGFTNLHSFSAVLPYPNNTNSDGFRPQAGLVLSGNTLYGTAQQGGTSGRGTVFAVNTDGTGFTNLHSLNGGSDGWGPVAGLVLSGNTLFGTAVQGGSSSNGTVFAVNTDGTGFTNLHSFTSLSDLWYLEPVPKVAILKCESTTTP